MKLNELKTSTVKSYLDKTVDPVHGIPKSKEKLSQRMKGISRAHERVVGNKPTSKDKDVDEGVAGPKNCWPGYKKVGTQPGTGKNKGKRVNDCEKIEEKWSQKYKNSINCSNPKGFSQKAHCAGRKKTNESLRDGEYYTWTVHFDDGTSQKINVRSDEVDVRGYFAKRGKKVEKIDYSFAVQGERYGSSVKDPDGDNQERRDREDRAFRQYDKRMMEAKKGLYYYVNKRKKAGTSRPASHPDAPSEQDWKNAAKTAKKESMDEDWQKVNKKDKTDGMSKKAVNAYRRENPGSKLKTAVTTKPSKLKKGSKSAKRRKSFCARMSGMKKAHASAKTKRNPDSPINKALRRWNCESIENLENQLTEIKLNESKRSSFE